MSDLLAFREELRGLLESIKDEGTSIDSGGGMGGVDLWVKVGGKEFYLHMSESKTGDPRRQQEVGC